VDPVRLEPNRAEAGRFGGAATMKGRWRWGGRSTGAARWGQDLAWEQTRRGNDRILDRAESAHSGGDRILDGAEAARKSWIQ
jgi:hypothetical protein